MWVDLPLKYDFVASTSLQPSQLLAHSQDILAIAITENNHQK